MRIGVIGAGHAGVEAARTARVGGAEVTLFSAEDVLPYHRPRLAALAFGQADFAAIQSHPPAWYEREGITLRAPACATALNAEAATVVVEGRPAEFDGLVIASGARPSLPPFAAQGAPFVLPLWDAAHANAIRQRVVRGHRLVVVGGGILGIEAALRGLDAGMSVTVVEHLDRLMPVQFGASASTVLLLRLEEKGIAVILGHRINRADPGPASVALALDDGRRLEAELCIVSIGVHPDKRLAVAAGLAAERGVLVDRTLRTSSPRCFAAGDVIQFAGLTRCSAQEAATQGRIAGANVVAALRAEALQTYQPGSLPLVFRAKDFEIYSLGAPGGIGYEEHLLEGTTESVIRSLVLKDGIPLGVQMIGTRAGFDEYVAAIQQRRG